MSDTRERIIGAVKRIAASGATNMFDSRAVQRLAFENGEYELVNFIEEHKKDYGSLILTGKFPEDFEP
ncbi:MAG: DUF5049 domain-containing protein [Lachnospiraceae bacterium]|nr:DUF5049 domain-containing protein [Lachnospiraceae bacterium]